MRPSRVLKKIRAGDFALCTKINACSPRLVEIAGLCGFDAVWLCMEHTPDSIKDIEAMINAAKMHNMDSMVRVSKGSYSDFVKPFELDASSIMIPHCMSLEEAKRIVYFTKFHPVGRRPLDGGNADGLYTMLDSKEYMRQANSERFNIIQIEDPEPLAELEAICELPGIDAIFFGPGDFSQGIGKPGDFSDPEVTKTRERIAVLARKYNKIAATVAAPAAIHQTVDMGYNFICSGADVIGYVDYLRNIMKAARGSTDGSGGSVYR